MINHEFMQPVENKLEACRTTRALAARAFHVSFSGLLQGNDPISEANLRDVWLVEMRKSSIIFPDGWYFPPPNGIGVLFGTEEDYGRMNYQSLRPEEIWPKKDTFLDREKGIIYVYASPVDKATGMIGDWGMTIYFGNNPDIIEHLKQCLYLNHQVLDYAKVDMSFADLTTYAVNLFTQQGLSNQITSITDTAGVNIGHTVPASYEQWTPNEYEIFESNDWEKTVKMISKKRKFLNTSEPLLIHNGMAFTIEQRLTRPDRPLIPMSSFHTIAVFHPGGRKELLTNFDDIFKLTGMSYMLES